jgi:hypothetical protein
MPSQKGFLGFFDILGYKSLLTNNDPKEIAKSVLQELTNLDSFIHSKIDATMGNFKELSLYPVFKDHLKWLVFSDTILLSLDLPESLSKSEKYIRLETFLIAAIFLQHALLNKGLPLRGALTYGPYLIDNTCFAGKPIVDAYTKAEELELSACVLEPSARQTFEKILGSKATNIYFKEYLVPLKKSNSERMLTLNYCELGENEDVRGMIFKSFFAFRKDIPEEVQQKILNTEQHLRFLYLQSETKEKERKKPQKEA